ncbi:MAG: T9SS type A sorting domain-containing protein [Candidatus Kapaibacterium sp.]
MKSFLKIMLVVLFANVNLSAIDWSFLPPPDEYTCFPGLANVEWQGPYEFVFCGNEVPDPTCVTDCCFHVIYYDRHVENQSGPDDYDVSVVGIFYEGDCDGCEKMEVQHAFYEKLVREKNSELDFYNNYHNGVPGGGNLGYFYTNGTCKDNVEAICTDEEHCCESRYDVYFNDEGQITDVSYDGSPYPLISPSCPTYTSCEKVCFDYRYQPLATLKCVTDCPIDELSEELESQRISLESIGCPGCEIIIYYVVAEVIAGGPGCPPNFKTIHITGLNGFNCDNCALSLDMDDLMSFMVEWILKYGEIDKPTEKNHCITNYRIATNACFTFDGQNQIHCGEDCCWAVYEICYWGDNIYTYTKMSSGSNPMGVQCSPTAPCELVCDAFPELFFTSADDNSLLNSDIKESKVYPNPNNGICNLEINAKIYGKIKIEVIDYTGKQIISKTLNKETGATECQINMSDVSSGTYLYKIYHENSIVSRGIIIKE